MPRTKKQDPLKFEERTYWHPYVLQSLAPEKFIRVVNKILKGEYVLLRHTPPDRKSSEDVPITSEGKKFFS